MVSSSIGLEMRSVERRLSERVQFFQLPGATDLIPVWVFQRAHPDTVLGLLLDISAAGIQILTDKNTPLPVEYYQLIVHADDSADTRFITAAVKRLWSKPEGALYVRNGFVFDRDHELASQINDVRAVREAGRQWLRCELAAL